MGLTALCMVMGSAVMGQPADVGGIRVAVVNVAVISEEYQRTAALEAQFEQKRLALNERRNELAKQIDTLGRSLQEELKPGTTAYDERSKQLALAEFEAQYFMEAEAKKIEQGLAQSLRSIYDDIQQAVRDIAEERGIDIVLTADMLPRETPENTNQARQQILLQKVVYWHPRVDLTGAVIKRLNETYQTKTFKDSQSSASPTDSPMNQQPEATESPAAA